MFYSGLCEGSLPGTVGTFSRGERPLYATRHVQKVRFKRKKPRDHEENKRKKYSVIMYKGLERMSLLSFSSKKVVSVFVFESVINIVKLESEGADYREYVY